MSASAHYLSENMARCRKQLGLTQRRLAASVGVSQSYISALERGDRNNIALDKLDHIADALSITVSMLLAPCVEQLTQEELSSPTFAQD